MLDFVVKVTVKIELDIGQFDFGGDTEKLVCLNYSGTEKSPRSSFTYATLVAEKLVLLISSLAYTMFVVEKLVFFC